MASPSAPPASTALAKSKKLKPRVPSIQLNILISFMEDHPQLARACTELTAEFTRDRRTLWWAELVRRHNSQGPANKTRAEWQQFWGAKVIVAKSKAGILSEDGRGTGGGPPRGSPLTPEEERILGILGGHSPRLWRAKLPKLFQQPAEDAFQTGPSTSTAFGDHPSPVDEPDDEAGGKCFFQ
ncbi:hypothetical protein HPB47_014641 [Ixodes persulcatus]|uniref:Uncharacterized protein n=1 Tax=Ixodes persulcatus TaxID=34615 RepID=A0AC60QVR2_IXOPE|nr:hypothetical protein HPB47_014641 [Ixodes persulcatus]